LCRTLNGRTLGFWVRERQFWPLEPRTERDCDWVLLWFNNSGGQCLALWDDHWLSRVNPDYLNEISANVGVSNCQRDIIHRSVIVWLLYYEFVKDEWLSCLLITAELAWIVDLSWTKLLFKCRKLFISIFRQILSNVLASRINLSICPLLALDGSFPNSNRHSQMFWHISSKRSQLRLVRQFPIEQTILAHHERFG
jgi:hypothetical protein